MKRNRPISIPGNSQRLIKVFGMLVIILTAGLSAGAGIKNLPAGLPYATAVNVTGQVTSENGGAVAGASVRVKGSNAGTATDGSGNYSLNNVADNAVLIFSSVGYQTLEVPVNGHTVVSVVLKISAVTGEQVVVVGYGTLRKRDITGAIASVKGSELAKQPVLTATQALQGKVAGVQIISSGAPNSAPSVRIRGTGSLLLGVEPLYVVDGVITDDIRNINSADITSLEVLKDASAAAIYGVRAAPGVILITTKKGRSGKMQISYNANAGIREASKIVKMANSSQYASYLNDASPTSPPVDPALVAANNTDWFDEILRTSFEENHNISLSGGNDKINYFLSAGYLTDQGIVNNNYFQRITVRSNNEYIISKKLRLNTLISFSNGNTRDVNLGAAYNDAYHAAPVIPAKIGGLYGNTSGFQNVGNPILDLDDNTNRYKENRLQATAYLDYKPVEWLTLRTSYSTELGFNNRKIYNNQFGADSLTFIQTAGVASGNQHNDLSSLSVSDERNNHWVWDNTATYHNSFGKNEITALAGFTSEQIFDQSTTGSRSNVPADPNLWYLNLGDAGTQTNGSGESKRTRVSYLGRVVYNYDRRYLLTATFRADGSSLFSSHYSYDPSIGLGWILTDENFMKGQKIFNNLKLRASYGRLGNDNIPLTARYVTLNSNLPYVFGTNAGVVYGNSFNGFADQNIRWETTDEGDAGFEFSVLRSHLSGEFDVYQKKTHNAINTVPVLATSTTATPAVVTTNIAAVENKGVELSLTWNDKVGKEINYTVSANGSYNQNRVVALNGGQAIPGITFGQGAVNRSDNGQPIGSYYVLQAQGVFHNQSEIAAYTTSTGTPIRIAGQIPELGDLKYKDLNDDGVIDDKDRAFSGSYQPKFTFGLNLAVTYKNFDLSLDGYGTLGSKIYNAKKEARFNSKDNIESSVADGRWTYANFTSNVPRATLAALPQSTYFIESGDFARINNLTVGYTIRKEMLNKYGISSLRMYLTSQNLATFTQYSGFSPEIQSGNQLSSGLELNAYPTTRTYAFGINLNF